MILLRGCIETKSDVHYEYSYNGLKTKCADDGLKTKCADDGPEIKCADDGPEIKSAEEGGNYCDAYFQIRKYKEVLTGRHRKIFCGLKMI